MAITRFNLLTTSDPNLIEPYALPSGLLVPTTLTGCSTGTTPIYYATQPEIGSTGVVSNTCDMDSDLGRVGGWKSRSLNKLNWTFDIPFI